MRHALIALSMLLGMMSPAAGQVSVGISVPGVRIGIHQPVYPQLVLVPGYPVYYAPRLNANYFFYDGMYWVYYGDNWYASTWYNGPWEFVDPYYVPLFVLRVPVRYYRAPPVYFRGWYVEAPPRWDHHWGPRWAQQRRGWDKWNRSAMPRPAPLPVYQRQYSGDRYPRVERQHALRSQQYRYHPREAVVQQRFQAPATRQKPASFRPDPRSGAAATRPQPLQRSSENEQSAAPTRAAPQQQGPAARDQRKQAWQESDGRAQQAPNAQAEQRGPHGRGEPRQSRSNPERRQGSGPERGRDNGKGHWRQ